MTRAEAAGVYRDRASLAELLADVTSADGDRARADWHRSEAARLADTAETLDRSDRPTLRLPAPSTVDAAVRALRKSQRLDEMALEAREHLGRLVAGMTEAEREAFAAATTG